MSNFCDHFKIESPTCISFSGGRTSAYMLWCVLQANGGKLPDNTLVCFANTGKEDEETLKFVLACSINWRVPIVWLEYQFAEETKDRFKQVTFETASRNGEPFEALIRQRNYLPNPVSRFCTVELKIRTIHRFLKSKGWTEWDSMLGIRADEPRRLAKIGNQDYGKHEEKCAPLGRVGVTKEVVGEFWRNMPFDLGLPNMNGVTMHGNCDLCFLKGGGADFELNSRKARASSLVGKNRGLGLGLGKQAGWCAFSDRPSKLCANDEI
jgi:3'-phosphoadenosine 5'-phosphosulfate sulfotransferase (PAPS reductase)/FAD synthetase